MTNKQKRFCNEYLVDLNATQAAIRAGYSPRTANVIAAENLTKPYIQKYIEKQLELMQSEKIATVQEVMEYLTKVMRGESDSEIVVTVRTGEGYSDAIKFSKKPDETERLRAAELLAKRYGLLKGSIQAEIEQVIIVNDLTE